MSVLKTSTRELGQMTRTVIDSPTLSALESVIIVDDAVESLAWVFLAKYRGEIVSHWPMLGRRCTYLRNKLRSFCIVCISFSVESEL